MTAWGVDGETPPSEPAGHRAARVAEPVRSRERVLEIDVLRGFAIFGILLVNVVYFAEPVYREVLDPTWPAPADRWVDAAVAFLAQGKFYTLFSLLFGLGLALQMERARERGTPLAPLFTRRLLVLLAFGLAHAFLFWWGDILTYYALLGFVLLGVRRASPRVLVRRAVLLAALPLLLNAALTGLALVGAEAPEAQASLEQARAQYREAYQRAMEVYRSEDWLAMIPRRIADWGFATMGTVLNGFMFLILAMFLLGLAVGKLGIARRPAEHLPLLRNTLAWGLLLGVPGNALFVALGRGADPLQPGLGLLASVAGYLVGAPALCLAYAAGLVLLMQRPGWRRRLAPLAAVGRTALSNYLLQTLVMTTLTYGYGFGLYGRIGPALALALAVAIYSLQVPLSRAWSRRFRFGPFEWVWRSLTYGRPQPLRRAEEPPG